MKRHITTATFGLIVLAALLAGFNQASSSYALSTTATPLPTPNATDAQPLIVWINYDPWRMVIGSDSPRFALYDDGQVIYYDIDEEGYVAVKLSEGELSELIESLALDEFANLDDYYEASDWTDQQSHLFYVWLDGEQKQVGVYGDPTLDEVRAKLPDALLAVYDSLAAFEHPNAEVWLPEKIEVLIWPYETSGGAEWPADWPGLDDPDTVERYEDHYSLFLDAKDFEEFRALMDEASGVAVIDGRTWAVSYRYPFPQEELWMVAQ